MFRIDKNRDLVKTNKDVVMSRNYSRESKWVNILR